MNIPVLQLPNFHKTVDADGRLTRIKVFGQLKPRDLLRFAENNGHNQRTPLVLWDLREAIWCYTKTEELVKNLEAARKFASSGFRTAYVLGSDADYGLGRVIESYTELRGFPGEYRPFKALGEAEVWLRSRVELADSPICNSEVA